MSIRNIISPYGFFSTIQRQRLFRRIGRGMPHEKINGRPRFRPSYLQVADVYENDDSKQEIPTLWICERSESVTAGADWCLFFKQRKREVRIEKRKQFIVPVRYIERKKNNFDSIGSIEPFKIVVFLITFLSVVG